MITVFTATFNRAKTLPRAFESLKNQTFLNFEWIIVDDGSNDDTTKVVADFATSTFEIKYIKQVNKGKHFAINKGVSLATGDVFFILDSDDFLPKNTIEVVMQKFANINKKALVGGVVGRKSFFDNRIVGSKILLDDTISNAIDIRYTHKIEGDLTEIYYTKVLKEFPFPEIDNEKFCPEALVWNRIAQKYSLLYFNESIYNCEYLADGLTSKIVKIRMQSPIATMLCYSELASYKIPLTQKIKATINFWRFAFSSKISFFKKLNQVNFSLSIIALPLGLLMHVKDLKKTR